MKTPFIFRVLIVIYFIWQIAECSKEERQKNQVSVPKSSSPPPPRAIDDLMRTNVPLPPGYGENVKHDPVDDSLRRIYDRNYMYYDPDNNFHDDDYWDGYYDD